MIIMTSKDRKCPVCKNKTWKTIDEDYISSILCEQHLLCTECGFDFFFAYGHYHWSYVGNKGKTASHFEHYDDSAKMDRLNEVRMKTFIKRARKAYNKRVVKNKGRR